MGETHFPIPLLRGKQTGILSPQRKPQFRSSSTQEHHHLSAAEHTNRQEQQIKLAIKGLPLKILFDKIVI